MNNKIGWCGNCSVFNGDVCKKLDENNTYDVGQCCYTCDMKYDCEDSCKQYVRYDVKEYYNGRNYWKCPNFNNDKELVQRNIILEDFTFEVDDIKSKVKEVEKKYSKFKNIKEIKILIESLNNTLSKF